MDMQDIRIISTVVMFLIFIAIAAWAYGGRQQERFARAARIPFEEDQDPGSEAHTAGETR